MPLIREFIRRANEEQSVDNIIDQMLGVFHSPNGALWFIRKGTKPVGYFYVELVRNEYDQNACLIHELMIAPKYSRPGLIESVDATIGAWAKLRNVREIVFYTRRNPNAFLRHLKNGWKLDSWILKRIA